MENTKIYEQLKSVPNQFLKTIQAGRLRGMSDIKPQWRILRLTEIFGACGFGWKIQNLKFSYEKSTENEIVCNCYLEFLYKQNSEWSEPIPGVGGSRFRTMEKNGAYTSDEAEKMAYTDAISVATKMIGLASDVYMGYGGKYDSNQIKEPVATPNKIELQKNTTQWTNAVTKLQNGLVTIERIQEVYNLSPEIKNELLKIKNK